MSKFERFKAWAKAHQFAALVLGGVIVFSLLVLLMPGKASAIELNAAWPVQSEGLTAATPQKVYIAPADSTNAMVMPSAYIIWEKSGNAIEIRRFYDNVAETEWIAIPSGQSFVIPAPRMYKRTGSTAWWHKFAVKGAAGDTVKILPMVR